ncbi:Alpha/Beta hydrolase protein [Coemansia spiralis]|nr:Alpha/Beta hydrolase protein [Coemansia spiralis]
MRLKQPTLCDSKVQQYSGYIDLDTDHVFFWYFESRARKENQTVPLVVWFSGGPGCSSQIANWQENGPCQYVASGAPSGLSDAERKALPHTVGLNPWAWNNVADLVFIDQPVGTGFSYGTIPNTTEAAADTAWRAMQAVYTLNRNKEVFVFGESYAGRYIPAFAEYVVKMNQVVGGSEDLQSRGFSELPLKGIGIGNGLFDYKLQAPTYKQMGCNSTYPSIFDKRQCEELDKVVNPRCAMLLDKCLGAQAASAEPAGADAYCNGALNWTTPVNTYDVRPRARMVPDDYVSYLRTSEFVSAVGASPDLVYEECSDPVFDRFAGTSDEVSRSSLSALAYLLEQSVPVLLYTGDADFICNWYGTRAVAHALEWAGQERFRSAPARKWSWPTKSGKTIAAGEFWAADNLTVLRVYEAGHEVPYYQPQASLYMLAQFLWHKQLY